MNAERRGKQVGRGLGIVVAIWILGLTACSGTTPDPSGAGDEQDSSSSSSADRWNAEDSELPGEPIPGKRARIKEGIHIRPGIDFAQLTIQESRRDIEITDDEKVAYVTGSARRKLAGKDRRDVLMGDGFIYLLAGPPTRTDRGLRVDLLEFSLIPIIWGDFELEYPEDFTLPDSRRQRERPDPVPPYRTKRQRINLPFVGIDLGFLSNRLPGDWEVTLSGQVDLGLNAPDVEGTFEGRIPIVADNYNCDSPDHLRTGCAWGRCVIDVKYCVERLRIAGSMDLNPDADMSMDVRGEGRTSFPDNQDLHPLIEERGLGEVTIPSSPISVGVEFLAGYRNHLRAMGSLDVGFGIDADATVTVGVEYQDGQGAEPIADLTVDDVNKSFSLGASAQLRLRHALESGLEWTVQPTGTNYVDAIDFQLETVRTTLELRWDSIYTYSPVSASTANQSNNGVPASVAGSCLRSKFVLSPYIKPEFTLDIGVGRGGYEIGDEIELINTADGDDGLTWRPYQWVLASVDGDGQYCLSQQECEDQGRTDCDQTPDLPDPGPSTDSDPSFNVQASWMNDTDVDIEVRTPDGHHLGAGHAEKAGAAEYPHDVCGGDIPCTDDSQANTESVLYNPADAAPSGTYLVKVTNDNGRRSANVDLHLRTHGHLYDAETVRLSGSSGATSGWIQLEK